MRFIRMPWRLGTSTKRKGATVKREGIQAGQPEAEASKAEPEVEYEEYRDQAKDRERNRRVNLASEQEAEGRQVRRQKDSHPHCLPEEAACYKAEDGQGNDQDYENDQGQNAREDQRKVKGRQIAKGEIKGQSESNSESHCLVQGQGNFHQGQHYYQGQHYHQGNDQGSNEVEPSVRRDKSKDPSCSEGSRVSKAASKNGSQSQDGGPR